MIISSKPLKGHAQCVDERYGSENWVFAAGTVGVGKKNCVGMSGATCRLFHSSGSISHLCGQSGCTRISRFSARVA